MTPQIPWHESADTLKAKTRQDLETIGVPTHLLDQYDATGNQPVMPGMYGMGFTQWYALNAHPDTDTN